jgi:hypothetical protein
MPYYLFCIDLAQHKQRKSGSKCWSNMLYIIEKIIKEKEKPLPTASESSDSSKLDIRCSSLIWSAENWEREKRSKDQPWKV